MSMALIAFFEDANTGTTLFRQILSVIDYGIYWIVSIVTNLMMNISQFSVTNEFIKSLQSRLYIVVAIYMLFKLAMSLLNGIVSPDSLTDKQAGMQKIIPRILISLSLLIIIPTFLFERLIIWQDQIARIVPAIIIGQTGEINSNMDSDDSIGQYMAGQTLQAFITVNPECEAAGATVEAPPNNLSITNVVTERCPKNRHIFEYNYMFLISSVVGIVMALIMLSFCLDIAIRALKLCVLQAVAPIPIISYIDPKSQKDGAFNTWVKTFVSTYIDLFLKLAIIYFVIFCIKQLFSSSTDVFSFGYVNSIGARTIVIVFLVIGLLFFARSFPKFVKDILGIKGGSGSLGLSGLMAGTAALAGGAGLMGALAVAGGALENHAEAEAQGKAPPSSAWRQGSDFARQIVTSNKNAKGGIMNRFVEEATKRANRNQLANLGLTQKALSSAKNNKYAAADAAAQSKDMYDRFINNQMTELEVQGLSTQFGHYDTSTGRYDMNETEKYRATQYLYNNMQNAQSSAAKASSNYEDANKEWEARGLKETFEEVNRPYPGYQATRASRKGAMTQEELMRSTNIANNGGFNPNSR